MEESFNESFSAENENIYAALSGAYNEVLQYVQGQVNLPSFGRKENYSVDKTEE
jgi:hypothetical protein